MIRTIVLIFASISFIIVIGGATYEHGAVVPVWASGPPASLSMFQGNYPLRAANFWIPIHPVTLALMAAALILNWRTERRTFILTTLAGYVAILLVTFLYIVPELVYINGSPFSSTVDGVLLRRAKTWEVLSLVRLAFLMLLALSLLYGLSSSDEQLES
jgi:hypothetical protein